MYVIVLLTYLTKVSMEIIIIQIQISFVYINEMVRQNVGTSPLVELTLHQCKGQLWHQFQ